MPPGTSTGSGGFPPSGPPTQAYSYWDPSGSGNWTFGAVAGVAIYDDAGTTKSDTLAFYGRHSTLSVFGPQSGTEYHLDGWVFIAKDPATGNHSGYWFFGIMPFMPGSTPGAMFVVGYNTDPSGAAIATLKFQGWVNLCVRNP